MTRGIELAANVDIRGDWLEVTQIIAQIPSETSHSWRLPTVEELNAIYDTDCFTSFSLAKYWSSTQADTYALTVSFATGESSRSYKTRRYSAKPVRDVG